MHYHETMLMMKFGVTVMQLTLPMDDKILEILVIRGILELLAVHHTIKVEAEVVAVAVVVAAVAAIAKEEANQGTDHQEIVFKVNVFQNNFSFDRF